jgi:hypothetical protein
MPQFHLPLSGNVTQSILPWSWAFNPVGSQVGLINIELGQSSAPAVEADVLSDVAGYGKQLGRIEDALLALIEHFGANEAFSPEQRAAFAALREVTDAVAAVKKRHGRA